MYGCSSLRSIEFPLCSAIGASAFRKCSGLEVARFGAFSITCGASVFTECTNLQSIYLQSYIAESYKTQAGWSSYASLIVPMDNDGEYVYPWEYHLTDSTISSVPQSKINARAIGGSAFLRCVNLDIASFPECSYVGESAFMLCSALKEVNLPKCWQISSSAFCDCPSISYVYLPKVERINDNAFRSLRSSATLYVGTSNCYLAGGVFSAIGNVGSIFVPTEYVDQYKVSTNWAKYSTKIFGYDFPDN
jgi:hypothetical protein